MAPPELDLANGGKVKGKGGPTDDKVGPVALSNGEYVLPADTVKAVGRENLDKLRMATHDFVGTDGDGDDKLKDSKLRKMANGGTFYADPEGVARRGQTSDLPPIDVAAPHTTSSTQSGGSVNTAGEEPPSAFSKLRQTITTGGGLPGKLVRGSLPFAVLVGGSNTIDDVKSGYNDRFSNSIDVNPVVGAGVRFLDNVGNAATFGLAGRLGRGLAGLAPGGEGFVKGFMSDSDRDQFYADKERQGGSPNNTAAQTQSLPTGVSTSSAGLPATPVQPNSYQSLRLAETGVPVDRQNLAPVIESDHRSLLRMGGGTPGQYVNLGSYGGNTNIYGTASRPGGRINSFVGVGPSASSGGSQGDQNMNGLNSVLRDTNARYDKLAEQLKGMYGPKGQGNLAHRLVDLEHARAGALNSLASAYGLNANRAAEMQLAQYKALQEAQTLARQNEEKGYERYSKAIGSMFIGPDGKPDAAKQEYLRSFIQASDPRAPEKLAAMPPQEQMAQVQNLKTLSSMTQARNRAATSGWFNSGAITNRVDMPVDVRRATLNDVINKHLAPSQYLYARWMPFTNPNVVVTESGQPVLLSDYAVDDGGDWDADKLNLILQRTGKDLDGRSALRGK
jgi:hypothetical protein